MVFKHFQNLFDLKYSINDFFHLFLVCSYVVTKWIFESITRVFISTRLLILAKAFSGIGLIIVGEVIY
jgi:hypothetical protein